MPVNVKVSNNLLRESNFNDQERKFLIDGFTNSFKLNYQGSRDRQDFSRNIPFTVGDKKQMWAHIMKEVKAGHYAGPFDQIPFKYFIQSPIGLVPKDGGKKTRLIFHLSYKFSNGNESINFWTPKESCSVRYNDLDDAIANTLNLKSQGSQHIYMAKTDLKMALEDFLFPGKTMDSW